MKRSTLIGQIKQKRSFLCIGLDIDLEKIPAHLLKVEDPLFSFSKAIVDATAPYAVAFKPNVDDLRESPALRITQAVANFHHGRTLGIEPNITRLPNHISNIDLVTKNPSGGEIERLIDGRANGILIDTAKNLVQQLIPTQTIEDEKNNDWY